MNITTHTPLRLATLALLPAVLLFGACKEDDKIPTPTAAVPPVTAPAPAVAVTRSVPVATVVRPTSDLRGHVTAIEPIIKEDKPTGAGAVIGGVVGGVLGHQVGGGSGKKVATAAGAVGGAVAGHKIERMRSEHVAGYRVSVRTETGNTRQFERNSVTDISVGSAVRIVEGGIQPA